MDIICTKSYMPFSTGVSNGAVMSVTPETNVLQESLLAVGILSKGLCSRGRDVYFPCKS